MRENNRKSLHKAIGASYSILGSLAFFGLGGYLLDSRNDGEKFWIIIGLILGVIIGLYELAKYILNK